ncbi:putative secreted protein [Sinobacterium caligoides]|uniref:Putative secreted protein n=1 Tax=Sinobacterium caligoides TaxID=933926 RepID=A0A3N2E1C5_9GAMM|nr:VPLPA-CTERM sorting domain-containing protein [Sinobacterium caligoides]ROS05449.1 putative secreted protein [Sinobacterium caligoides]
MLTTYYSTKRIAALTGLLFIIPTSFAATVMTNELPASFTGSLTSPQSSYEVDGKMAAYNITDSNGDAGFLINYTVSDDSNSLSGESINGNLWVQLSSRYNLTGNNSHAHKLSFFFDHLNTPPVGSSWYGGEPSHSVYLSDQALLSSQGWAQVNCCSTPAPVESNTMQAHIQPCFDEGCIAALMVNLPFISAIIEDDEALIAFNNLEPSDQRIYHADNIYTDPQEGYFQVATLSVSEVPLPTTAWLLGTALLGLSGLKRKK